MIRFRDYFSLSIPFLLYYIFINIKLNKNKLLFILLTTIYCFVGYYRYVYTYGGLVPYDSYIFKEEFSLKNS